MQMIKSIKSLHPCKFILIVVFLKAILIYSNRVVADDEYEKIIQDLPTTTDFAHYLSALERVVDFCVRHKHYVDLNVKVGLIMINVNLGQVLKRRRKSIPENARSRLEKLLVKNDAVNIYYQKMVQKHKNDSLIVQNKKFVQLFYNATWSRRPDKFNKDLLYETKFYSPKEMEDIYGEWQNYRMNVDNYEAVKPSPAESDECTALLALNDPLLYLSGLSEVNCLTPYHCKEVLLGGNQFGYGLSHRIFYMVIARFYQRCVVFSENRDKSKTDMYCKKCINEVKYIASNSFQLPDLMYEQIALCGLLGHAQFLCNNWLKGGLRYQTTEGCFSESLSRDLDENQIRDDENDEWKIQRPYSSIMNGQCDGHFTAVAAGALSNALRYIIETYY